MTTIKLYHPPEPETLTMSVDEAKQFIRSDRKAQTSFCHNCYDFGKADDPPDDCKRCHLLHVLRKEGDDMRQGKSQPPPPPDRRFGLWVCLFVLLGVWWVTLMLWTADSERHQAELQKLQRRKQ